MEDDPHTIHGAAELVTGDRADLFSPDVLDKLVHIVCGDCGLQLDTHEHWEDHVRDMLQIEDPEHNFLPQVLQWTLEPCVGPGFPCQDCGAKFANETDRDYHRVNVSTCVMLICPQCAALASDMEQHLLLHKTDVICGECGNYCGRLDSHMNSCHSGYMSTLVLQTVRCSGDGETLVSLELVLATNARFLASEVKPALPPAQLPATPLAQLLAMPPVQLPAKPHARLPAKPTAQLSAKSPAQLPAMPPALLTARPQAKTPAKPPAKPPTKLPARPPAQLSAKPTAQISAKPPAQPSGQRSGLLTPSPAKKNDKKVHGQESPVRTDITDRERALAPPDYLPREFFNEQGERLWNKLPSSVHQCELCGFMAKTKNKYREKQDHVMKWHFSARIESIIPITGKKPFSCPFCPFTGKDRQCVVRHYTGKHSALELWMAEFLQAVSSGSVTPQLLQVVENVDIEARPGDLQKPYLKKIVRSGHDELRQPTNPPPALDSRQLIRGKIINCAQDLSQQSINLPAATISPRQEPVLRSDPCVAKTAAKKTSALGKRKISDRPGSLQGCSKCGKIDDEVSGHDCGATVSEKCTKKVEPAATPLQVSDVTEVTRKSARKPVPSLKALHSRHSDDQNQLELEEVEGEGLRCLSCLDIIGGKKIPSMKSMLELRDHIRSQHMELCILACFLPVRNLPAKPGAKPFNYLLCTLCGKCFSQASGLDAAKKHREEEHGIPDKKEQKNHRKQKEKMMVEQTEKMIEDQQKREERQQFEEEDEKQKQKEKRGECNKGQQKLKRKRGGEKWLVGEKRQKKDQETEQLVKDEKQLGELQKEQKLPEKQQVDQKGRQKQKTPKMRQEKTAEKEESEEEKTVQMIEELADRITEQLHNQIRDEGMAAEDGLDEVAEDAVGSDSEESSSSLSRSEKSRKNGRPLKCPCENCANPAYAPGNGIRMHPCWLEHNCLKVFRKATHLKAHVRAYNNERPFACDISDCGKRFVRRDELKRHAWIHSGEARFRCECGRGYGRADHFRNHEAKCHLSSADHAGTEEPLL